MQPARITIVEDGGAFVLLVETADGRRFVAPLEELVDEGLKPDTTGDDPGTVPAGS